MHEVQTLTRLVRAVDDGTDTLDVGVPATLGAPVGVAHRHAERRLLATHIANRCHDAIPQTSNVGEQGNEGSGTGAGSRQSPGGIGTTLRAGQMADPRRPLCRRPARRHLRVRRRARGPPGGINRLNVYPVPDGDTGTNMALTLESVVEELTRRRRRHGRDLQGHQPRLADGGAGQLRRDPLADPAGDGRRRSVTSTAPTGRCMAAGARSRPARRPTARSCARSRAPSSPCRASRRPTPRRPPPTRGLTCSACSRRRSSGRSRRPGPHARAAAGAGRGGRRRCRRQPACCC